jgi:thymidylate kinase
MIVICLEGCHGSGKTQLCNEFESYGFDVLDEAFLDMPEYALHPQSLLMETTWVCSWFERVLKKASDLGEAARHSLVIADRSPFSAVFYSQRNGHLLEPLIRSHMDEVREAADIHIYTVHIDVPRELLWQRISERLAREPERLKYNEGKEEWMDAVLGFYSGMTWDLSVTNAAITIPELMHECLRSLFAEFEPLNKAAKASPADSPLVRARSHSEATSSAFWAMATAAAGESPTSAMDEEALRSAGAGGVAKNLGSSLAAVS